MPNSNLIGTYLGSGPFAARPTAVVVPGCAFYWGTDTGLLYIWTGTTWVVGSGVSTLTFGTHLTSGASSYNGSSPVTITSDATSSNTASTIVARDSSGNFSAGTITASLTGTASNASALGGATFAAPGAIGGGSASTGAFTALTATTINGNTITTSTGTLTLAASSSLVTSGAFSHTLTITAPTVSIFPPGSHTLPGIDFAQTWTAAQTFTNSNLLLLGSSTGKTIFTSDNASATDCTLHFPAYSGRVEVAATNPTTQTTDFPISNSYKLWPVTLSAPLIVTLPTTFTQDFEIVIKAIGGTGSDTNTLSAASPVDGITTLIQSAGGWVRLYFSVELGIWSIVG